MKLNIHYIAVTFLACQFLSFMPFGNLQAQVIITPTVQPSVGGTFQNGKWVMTYTVGQLPTQISQVNNLVLTPGFQQPIKPEPPLVPAAQTMCSDTAYTFIFNTIAGKGAKKVQWATNRAFTGAHMINSPGSFSLTVAPGVTDTIWLRSVDTTSSVSSLPVFTTATVHSLPNVSISPLDTVIWAGQSAILAATGGVSYSWPQLGLDTQSVFVTPAEDTNYYIVVAANAYGCTNSAQTTVFTIDTLILSVTGGSSTINPGDSTYITATANINGTTITWERNNLANVSGNTSGSGGVIRELFVNHTDSLQKVDFLFSGTYGPYHAHDTIVLGYEGPISGLNIHVTTSGDTVAQCGDTLTVTTKYVNLTSNTGYDTIQQIIPSGANLVSLSASCSNVNTSYDTTGRIIWWYINNAPPDSCILTMKLTFNCNTNSNDTSHNTNLITTICATDTANITALTIGTPSLSITAFPPSQYAMYGQAIVDSFKICAAAGVGNKIYNLNLLYEPEYELGQSPGNPIILTLENISGGNSITLATLNGSPTYSYTHPDTLQITSAEIQHVLGTQDYIDATHCIVLKETDTVESCYSYFQSPSAGNNSLSFTAICNTDSLCTPASDEKTITSNIFVLDDYVDTPYAKDNSPIQISSPKFFQNGLSVVDTGVNPCDSFIIQYTIVNPVRSDTSLPQEANFKFLQSLYIPFRTQWFYPSYYVTINNIHSPLTSPPVLSYVGGDTGITIYFDSVLTAAIANQIVDNSNDTFLNNNQVFWPMPSADSAIAGVVNTMLANQAFTISLHLQVNPNNPDVTSCDPYLDFNILFPPKLSYYTMCGHYNTVSNNYISYANNLETGVYGDAQPMNAAEGGNDTLNLCWQQYSGAGNPWLFEDDSLNRFFNCPTATYVIHFQLSPEYSIAPSTFTFGPPNQSGTQLSYTHPNDSTYILTGAISSVGCLSAIATFQPDTGFCHGLGGHLTASASLLALCPGCSIEYCIGTDTNELLYHCSGACSGTGIGLVPHNGITSVTIVRDTIPSESLGTGSAAVNRAYPCDEVDIITEGQAFASAGFQPDSIYLQITYSQQQIPGSSIFKPAGADYRLFGDTAWTAVSSNHLTGPFINDSSLWEIDASLPYSCGDSDSISSIIYYASDSFYIRLHVIVDDNIPYINNGVNQLQGIQANMCIRDCSGNSHSSCDPADGGLLILNPKYDNITKFLLPDDMTYYPYTYTDICTQRLLIQTYTEGGLSSGLEMPNELRPIFIWPTDSGPDDTLTISNFTPGSANPADMSVSQIQFTYPTQYSSPINIPLDAAHFKDTLGTIQIFGITLPNSTIGWPVFDKNGSDFMQLLILFDKLTCANVPETPIVKFKRWERGMDSCITPASYFNYHTTDSADIYARPVTQSTNDAVTIEMADTTGGTIYNINASVSLGSTAMAYNSALSFNQPAALVYTGDIAGVNNTWVYVSALDSFPGYLWITGDTLADGLYYRYPGSFLYPDSEAQHFNIYGRIDTTVGQCVTGRIYTITLITGYSCDTSGLRDSIPPAATDSSTCGYRTSTIKYTLDASQVSITQISTLNLTETACDTDSITMKISAKNTAPLFDPYMQIAIPPGVEITSVHIQPVAAHSHGITFTPDSGTRYGPDTLNLNDDSINGHTDIQYLDSVSFGGHTFFLPADSSITVTIYFTEDTRDSLLGCANGYVAMPFIVGGKDVCGKTITPQSLSAAITFNPFTCPACQECKHFPDTFNFVVDSVRCGPPNGIIIADVTGGSTNGIFTYKWSGPGGYSDSTADTIISSLSQPGMYYLTVTDGNRCRSTDSVNLPSAKESIVSNSIKANASFCPYEANGEITLQPFEGTPPYRYLWSNGDTTRIITGLKPGGIYSATVTDSIQCTFTASYTIGPPYVYTADTILSDTLNIPADTIIYFNAGSTLIVDSTFTLQNCEVVMGPNSAIIVGENDTFNVFGSKIHGCDTMWQGIYLKGARMMDADSSHGQRSVIADATYAVQAEYGGESLFLRNTDFYRNEQGVLFIRADDPSETSPYGLGLDISNCYFGMGPYTEMLVGATSIRPQYGIGMAYSDSILIPNPYFNGKPNTFQGMNEGIDMAGSFVYLYTNYFDSIKQYDSLGCGCAVNAFGYSVLGDWGSGELLVQPATAMPDTSSTITFKDCDVGVQSQYQRVKVCDARMENVTSCVKAMNYDAVVWVDSNYFNHTDYGVYLSNNLGGQQVVSNNTFYVNPPNFEVYVPDGYPGGFPVPATTYAISEYEISNNVSVSSNIYNNLIYSGRNGILLNNVDSAFIYTNTIHQRDQTSSNGAEAGIYAGNCVDLFIDSNYVDGDTTPSGPIVDTGGPYIGSYIKHGFYLYESAGEICNNTLGATNVAGQLAFGLLFAGQCTGTDIYNNEFNRNTYAIYLGSSGSTASIGDQGYNNPPDNPLADTGQSNANDFNGDGTTSHNFDGGFRTFSDVTVCDTCPYFNPIFYYTGSDIPSNTQTTDTSQGMANNIINHGVAILARAITSTNFSPYNCKDIEVPDLTGWKALQIQVPIITGRKRLNNFDMLIVHDSASYYMEPGYEEVGAWLAREALYKKLAADRPLLNANLEMQQFFNSVATSTIGQMNEYEAILKTLSSQAVARDTALYKRTLQKLNGVLEEMAPTNVPEQNFMIVNNIYAKRLNHLKDTLTQADRQTLAMLAIQCPYVAGDAVYAARTLLSQVDPHWHFDDRELCNIPKTTASQRSIAIDSNMREYVKVFPNPTGSQLNVAYSANTAGQAKFEMINSLGQTVKLVILQQGVNSATFDVSNLDNGIYHWSLKDNTRIIASGKESIVR